MRVIIAICLIFHAAVFAVSQEQDTVSRGSIPEELLRPKRGEAPHYPIDTVIGQIGQGEASDAAYSFANLLARGFLSGNIEHSGLSSVNMSLREDYLAVLGTIEPSSFRLGGGREEPDGAVSFLVRFLGREQGITGELFIRLVTRQTGRTDENGEAISSSSWVFEDLILEEAKNREEENREVKQRFDFSPYERFF